MKPAQPRGGEHFMTTTLALLIRRYHHPFRPFSVYIYMKAVNKSQNKPEKVKGRVSSYVIMKN
jgi:hypothetical protein